MINKNYSEILTEATIDNLNFQVTWNPYENNSCILWCRNIHTKISFTALGKFSDFNKRKILDFIIRYCTTPELQNNIEKKKFDHKLNNISLSYFDHIELTSFSDKEKAYRNLFALDTTIAKEELKARRKQMAKKFHPDAGGNDRAMTIINEAYDYLMTLSEN